MLLVSVIGVISTTSNRVYAASQPVVLTTNPTPKYGCGSNDTTSQNAVGTSTGKVGFTATSIDLGCKGDACVNGNTSGYCHDYHNPIVDAAFSIIQFLSIGVGIVLIGSMVWAGIQFSLAHDDSGQVSRAKDRIRTTIIALFIYIFAYAILNYLIPAGFFNQ